MTGEGRILIVDDDPRNISRIEQALRAIERESVSAGDGAQALAILAHLSGPHGFAGVVITDMKMPVMDGLEFLERVRTIDSDLPVILITAYGDVASAVKAMKNGAYDFIERPFDADMLRTRVLRALEKRELVLENRRRHRELTEALAREEATGATLAIVSRSPADPQPVFDAIAESARRLCDGDFAAVFRFDGRLIFPVAVLEVSPEARKECARTYPRPLDAEDLAGRAISARAVVHAPDVERSTVAVPMLRDGEPVGSINVSRREPRPFSDAQIALLKTFADQAVIAIENARQFSELEARNRELADKSRQLEVASQHKSEFLANMSHELRTPLNAILGFSEVLVEGMFGDVNDKQTEYLNDVLESGRHLLSLINDILDLSKIEAGRMELEATDFDLPQAIDNALMLVRERAGRQGIALHQSVEASLREIRGDERKVKQVLLNLLSNALKFTPEGGRADVRAGVVDGMAEVSVTDTGSGIALEDQETVFEEFRQVGTAAKKIEGTGLGLALSRKFIELHGGRISVKSALGAGATFTFTLPVGR